MLPTRRHTNTVSIGSIKIGGSEPVRIQSMLTSDTTNVESCIEEIARLDAVDCEIIRLTVPNQKSIDSLPAIRTEMKKRGIERPLVADIHFNPQLAVNVCEFVEKVRINP
ncbi:MAG: flavodoxin-dependent (E)-4-hydroxy-3-methylbut-2-enyl-diphosphate synthase, partial [Candidatus Lambdaproteobacteria bacterium]